MSLPKISPAKAKRLLDQGAILVDIREADEHAREKIIGARHLPLSKLDEADLALHEGKPVIFHCKSGARTMSQCLPARAENGRRLRSLHHRGRARCLEEGGTAGRDRSPPADRTAAAGADRCRQPRIPRDDAGLWSPRGFLRCPRSSAQG